MHKDPFLKGINKILLRFLKNVNIIFHIYAFYLPGKE